MGDRLPAVERHELDTVIAEVMPWGRGAATTHGEQLHRQGAGPAHGASAAAAIGNQPRFELGEPQVRGHRRYAADRSQEDGR